jgi:carbon-monoxide dehydrogenase large subunit
VAIDTVRFVGEPVAFVVAETLAQAKDAAELVVLETANHVPLHGSPCWESYNYTLAEFLTG